MGRKASDQIPPYVSYRTFTSFLAELKRRGLPSRIDRSVMAHKSGTIQSQLLLTLRYLDLVGTSGRPTSRMSELVDSEGRERKAVLAEIVKQAYGMVFDGGFGLSTATTHQAEELFQRTGASGETLRRCIGFFLAAARDSGIEVSSYIRPHRRPKSVSRRKDRVPVSESDEKVKNPLSEASCRKIQLRSGGSLTLEISVDVFVLDADDRQFVFELVDRLKKYEGR